MKNAFLYIWQHSLINVSVKEYDSINKYNLETEKIWKIKSSVIPIIIGALSKVIYVQTWILSKSMAVTV